MSKFLTVTDVARKLNMMPDTVREMERQGRLKAIRTVGGVRLFQEDEVERFAQARQATPLRKAR